MNECIRCGKCCKLVRGIGIFPEDIERWKNECRDDIIKKLSDFSKGCPFLVNDNVCSIHATKPYACLRYPHWSDMKWAKSINCHMVEGE